MSNSDVGISELELRKMMLELKIKQRTLAKVFRRSPEQIFQAIKIGNQPTLRRKIEKYVRSRWEKSK